MDKQYRSELEQRILEYLKTGLYDRARWACDYALSQEPNDERFLRLQEATYALAEIAEYTNSITGSARPKTSSETTQNYLNKLEEIGREWPELAYSEGFRKLKNGLAAAHLRPEDRPTVKQGQASLTDRPLTEPTSQEQPHTTISKSTPADQVLPNILKRNRTAGTEDATGGRSALPKAILSVSLIAQRLQSAFLSRFPWVSSKAKIIAYSLLLILLATRAFFGYYIFNYYDGFTFLMGDDQLRIEETMRWARNPEFKLLFRGGWPALFFWINGAVAIIYPHPVVTFPAVNTIFTLGYLALAYFVVRQLGIGPYFALLLPLYLSFEPTLVSLSLSALAEPQSIFF
ncbi:MAG: hypothetical protein N3E40_03940, partial [Dehalococcoidia bacterium]|nr:hypothetical protein [Dehalococcoidia bacterium]